MLQEKLEVKFHVQFVATLPHATPLEIMQGVHALIEKAFAEPIVAWDCVKKEEVLLQPYTFFFPGDNPMQAKLCSSAGLNSNHFCCTCKAGGSQEYKQSDEGFASVFKPNVATALSDGVKETGIKDALAQPIIDNLVKLGAQLRKTAPGCVDISQDTPTEILHTILLGVVKYFWGQTVFVLERDKQFDLFQAHLNSIVEGGLNVPEITANYMCHYCGGLIGKHFKTLAQVMAFTDILNAWLILGRLIVLLWHTEIKDIDQYTAEVDECVNDFLNITAQCSPIILITKPKFHFLVHLAAFIRRFGPAVMFSTERYESYNAVFCAASIYSNKLAPSRNIG
ncbi:hypothetical protein B0H34DRAFT_782741 [Crassisporium funariophilum]|nr:hypothetical protein B0H34DRAFT_782741 [Crassisporium funariophilum]